MSRQKLAVTATLLAAGAFASQANAAQTVDIDASVSGTYFDVNGDGRDDFTFTKDYSDAVSLDSVKFAGSAVGPVSQTAYYPERYSDTLNKGQSVIENGYYGLVFNNTNVFLKDEPGTTTYTGYALVDGDGSHISELDFHAITAITAVPEPESWALMILGMGAIGATLRQRRRAASSAAAFA